MAQIGQALRVARGMFGLEQNLGATSPKGVGTARECPTRLKREKTRNAPGKENPSERSNRSRSPGDEPRHPREKATKTPGLRETSKR